MEHNIENLIADYLSDTLDAETRQDFERKMAANPDLQARVALERDLENVLNSASPENKLLANLQHIAQKFDTAESLEFKLPEVSGANARRRWPLFAGLLALGGLVYWSLTRVEKQTMILPPAPKLESPVPPPADITPTKTETESSKTLKKDQPIAAAFKPIPKLEPYIGSQTRSDDFHIRLKEPQTGATLPLRSAFRLSGKIEGALPAHTSFKVLIYTNNQQDFEDIRPFESFALEPNAAGEFLIQKQLRWTAGLYYIMFEDQQSGAGVYVDKFFVK